MVSSVTSTPTLAVSSVKDTTTDSDARLLKRADAALHSLLQNGELVQSFVEQSDPLFKVSRGKVLSTLWSLLKPDNIAARLTRPELQKAIFAEGGGTADVDALWTIFDFEKKGYVNVGEFATNTYLLGALDANLDSIHETVEARRMKNSAEAAAGTSGTILDAFAGGSGNSGTMLDLFA